MTDEQGSRRKKIDLNGFKGKQKLGLLFPAPGHLQSSVLGFLLLSKWFLRWRQAINSDFCALQVNPAV